MIIGDAQMEILSLVTTRAFEERMVKMVGRLFPEKVRVLEPEQLRELIRSAIDRGKRYGIVMTGDLETFIGLIFRFPTFNFEDEPESAWTREILEDETLTPEEKLDRIDGRASLSHLIGEEES